MVSFHSFKSLLQHHAGMIYFIHCYLFQPKSNFSLISPYRHLTRYCKQFDWPQRDQNSSKIYLFNTDTLLDPSLWCWQYTDINCTFVCTHVCINSCMGKLLSHNLLIHASGIMKNTWNTDNRIGVINKSWWALLWKQQFEIQQFLFIRFL